MAAAFASDGVREREFSASARRSEEWSAPRAAASAFGGRHAGPSRRSSAPPRNRRKPFAAAHRDENELALQPVVKRNPSPELAFEREVAVHRFPGEPPQCGEEIGQEAQCPSPSRQAPARDAAGALAEV